MNASQPKSRIPKVILAAGVLLVACVVGIYAYYRVNYPFGASHCCSVGVGLSLRLYADEHGGHFPAGGGSPEASLSLLYSNYLDAYTLRGKTVPLRVVEAALAKDGKLGPDSCGWHYVEGLTEADNPQIAILWDKVGLDHNGRRLRGGGHEVVFVDGDRLFVSGSKWNQFLEDQKRLLAQRDDNARAAQPALTGKLRFADGTLTNAYDGDYILHTKSANGSGTSSGTKLELNWMRLYGTDGRCVWELELPGKRVRSKPVTFEVKSGRANPASIVFEMEPY